MDRHETNAEFLERIMNFAPTGAMSQMFVLEAISKYSELVAKAPPMQNALISGEMWKKTAEWMQAEFKRHLDLTSTAPAPVISPNQVQAIQDAYEVLAEVRDAVNNMNLVRYDWGRHEAAMEGLADAFPAFFDVSPGESEGA